MILHGAKCGAVLALVPGVGIALAFYILSFGFGDNPLIMGPLGCAVVTGAIVLIGATLGAAVGGLVGGFRVRFRKSHGAV